MITESEIQVLLKQNPDHPALSLYLNTDRSDPANWNRKYLVVLKDLFDTVLHGLPQDQKEQFLKEARSVQELVVRYKGKARGLVVFSDQSHGFLWMQELFVPVKSRIHWDKEFHLMPLLELLDEYERYGVVLADQSKARLFVYFLGELEEKRTLQAAARVRRIKHIGKDRLRSQKKVERQSEVHAHWHLAAVAKAVQDLAARHKVHRLLLAGPKEAVAKLYRLFPRELKVLTAETFSLPLSATDAEIKAAAQEVEQSVEHGKERDMVKDLITLARKGQSAVLGREAVMQAARSKTIAKLIYADGYASQGVLEYLIDKTLEQGKKAEHVLGEAAELLLKEGGIGAVLSNAKQKGRIRHWMSRRVYEHCLQAG